MKIAKKIFFIILIILVVLFSTYVVYEAATKVCGLDSCDATDHSLYKNYTDSSKFLTSSNPDNWTLGKTMGLGLCDVESYTTWNSTLIHKGRFKQDFLMRGNKDFYCIEPGQDLSTGEYQYVAKIVIDENNVYLTKNGVTGTIKGNETGIARHSTRELVEILKRAKAAANSNATYTDKDGAHENVGTQYLRERGEHYKTNEFVYLDFSFKYDVYQRVVWKHLNGWRNTVFGSSQLLEIGTGDNSEVNSNRNDADLLYAAEYEADNILSSVYATINDESIRETGVAITDNSSDNIKNKELSTSQKYGNYTILGPFKYDYKGTARFNIYFNSNTSNSNASVSIGTWNGSTFTGVSTIPDNSNFYVKVPTNYLTSSIKTLNIDVEVNSTEEKTTLYILKSVNDTYQNAMYVKQTSTPISDSAKFSYDIETLKTVTLEKKSTEGQALPNVTFKLYDENGTGKGTYTTNENGKIIIQNLEVGKKYIVEETSNKAYGGRGANIANATISAGGRITSIDKENKKITFELTDNATLLITNTIDLGKITIRKIDNTSGKEIKLKGVEFVLWDMTVGWVSLYDKNTGEYIDKIDKTNEINLLDYVIKQSNEDNLPTKFVTNSNGEIVINNLQINYSIDKKNCFLVSEVTNNNYGYKGMILESGNIVMSDDNTRIIKEGSVEIENGSLVKFDDTESCIRQKDKSVKFNIDKNAILTINNIPKLGDLQIIKIGENSVPLPNVKFAVWQEGKGFIRLTDTAFKQEIVSANNIDLLKYKIDYTENQKEATKFVTNSEGIINITNFEVYSGVDSEGNAIQNVYVVREVENPNYGYTAMILEENKVTINEKSIGANNLSSSIDDEKREIKFTMQGDTEINIENIPQFSNLTIEKVGGDGKTKQQNVEFVIWQLSGGYVRLYEEKENALKFVETIDSKLGEPIDFKKYVIGYSADATGEVVPTRFITNELGQIQISNIETYNKYDKNKKNCHFISEVRNDNYGYSARIIEDATIIDGEFIKFDNEESYIRQKDSAVKFNLGKNTILTIKNKPQLGNLLIKKENTEGEIISNVEFELWQHLKCGYVRLFEEKEYGLKFVDRVMSEDGKPIDFEKYIVEYVSEVTENTLPTRFITNELGQIQINNLETHYNSKLAHYFISEVENDNYGYKGMIIEEATIDGGTLVNFDNTESYIRQIDRAVKFTITENTTLTIKNSPQLGNILINKESTDGTVLQNVEFIIIRGENEYVVIKDSNGNNLNPNNIDATAIIDIDGQFENNEYTITYSTDKDKATVFITGEEGIIDVRNLEIYKPYVISRPKIGSTEIVDAQPVSYDYTIQEISNPNYGYALTNTEEVIVNLEVGKTTEKTLMNTQKIGHLEITKQEKFAEELTTEVHTINLGNVGFAIQVTTEGSDKKGYLSLYTINNEFVPEVKGVITINSENELVSTSDGSKYILKYTELNNEYNDLKDSEKDQITTFVTGEDGKLTINNLEILERNTGKTYQYKLIEVKNDNYGYKIDESTTGNITLKEGEVTEKTVLNKQYYAKLSGYVWLEETETSGKSKDYDLLYKSSTNDIKLTDLYRNENGKVIFNDKADIPVQIKLIKDGIVVKEKPDEFDESDGRYTFSEVKVEDLKKYSVIFEYDGFKYTTIIPNLKNDNGSKVKEDEEERTILNSMFGSVKYDDELVSEDGQHITHIKYGETKEHKSSLEGFEEKGFTNIHAETFNDFNKEFYNKKVDAQKPIEGLNNLNMGIVLREQPSLYAYSDIHSVLVNVGEYSYTYYYGARNRNEENTNEDILGVKFQEETQKYQYSQTVYSSDLEALEKGLTSMDVSIIYKISLENESNRLISVIDEIENYYDGDYTIEAIGLNVDEDVENNNGKKVEVIDLLDENMISQPEDATFSYEEGIAPIEGKKFNSIKIMLGEDLMTLSEGETKNLYIKFSISQDAIKELLNEKSTFHNATEIIKYSTYYGENTGKGKVVEENGNKFAGEIITETQIGEEKRVGQVYAGITLDSRPGNIELELIKNPSGDQKSLVLNTSNFESDSTSAPSFILQKGERIISGNVFEDLPTYTENREKLGNGILDNGETPIQDVEVSLCYINENGSVGDVATYSDGETLIQTRTNEKGEYTLGDGNFGISPGVYVIKYTYGSWLDGEEKVNSHIVGKYPINVMDYKSTIIVSQEIKDDYSSIEQIIKDYEEEEQDGDEEENANVAERVKLASKQDQTIARWFVSLNNTEYSSAKDNLAMRAEYQEGKKSLTYESLYGLNGTKKIKTDVMTAYSPIMNIGIEFTKEDFANAVETDQEGNVQPTEFKKVLGNVNFGIIERPNINIDIDKEITGLEIIAQNGKNIIPMGNPSDINSIMQNVSKHDEIVSAQIDTKLLQGAQLNLEYTVTVKNNSERDFIHPEYYYYGTKETFEEVEYENTSSAEKVVDYLDTTIKLDNDKNEDGVWEEVEASYLDENGYINAEVYKALAGENGNEKNYQIFTTSAFANMGIEDEKSVKMYATKILSVSDSLDETNRVEIIEVKGKRLIKGSEPGNYVPVESEPLIQQKDESSSGIIINGTGNGIGSEQVTPDAAPGNNNDFEPIENIILIKKPLELDSARADLKVLSPTGITVDYKLYMIGIVSMLTIVFVGIIIIKKKIMI